MDKLAVIEFLIFNRDGKCLFHLDLQKNVTRNLAIDSEKDNNLTNRYKLVVGLLFAMREFVKVISPRGEDEFLKSFKATDYKLHYEEFLNGLRFVLFTSPTPKTFNAELKEIFNSFYVALVSKNPFSDKNSEITSELFFETVKKYLYALIK